MDVRPDYQVVLDEKPKDEADGIGPWLWGIFFVAAVAVKILVPFVEGWLEKP